MILLDVFPALPPPALPPPALGGSRVATGPDWSTRLWYTLYVLMIPLGNSGGDQDMCTEGGMTDENEE